MLSCPWAKCLEEIGSNPRLLALGQFLWKKNPKGLSEWTIDLDKLKQQVWGDEVTPTSTVRSLVSDFRKHLEAHNVPLTISVHDTRDKRRVRCTLPKDFKFDLS
ncbi:hypothetical protein RSSM_03218 [Rhodopirellula sallentina SM41]|uniref:Uncharacterized protein n=1 Tax=Rhodopirellula sallentina SM41 TaxID=1263870 RepID=M5UC23_9BACT|nr:hypothetical protein RSSM_03218 [Rhodopirellula sallentina SM41]